MIYPWHQALWQQLHTIRQAERLAHALLLSGQAGCGHEAVAQTLANALLCTQPDAQGFACGQCRSCQVQQSGAHPDFLLIQTADDKQIIGVDQLRELVRFLGLSCSYSHQRVALLPEAAAMNMNAANSLLKSLEEPAAQTHIILYTTRPTELLPTIMSRCQQFKLPLPPRSECIHWLQQQSLVQAPETLLKLAQGCPLTALTLDDGELLAQRQLFLQHLLEAVQGRAALGHISSHWEKYSRETLIDWQLNSLYEILRQTMQLNAPAFALDEPLQILLGYFETESLWSLYDQLLELKRLATHPLNARLFIENMLALWCNAARKH